ncbi:acylphosphatase [Persephonella sp. KM09-Lau-8]|uniref:acylphosphatase n=1 Tax=Persephonella sp. KM09-Lau-8 TaxID=1158345 RepID=UPI000496824B|nr:acylphosphatase [Persephonella sp. KM09-Lau-8]
MRLYAVFAGTVQGVGFRYFVRNIAKEMGVKGYVRNLPDGTVEVVAEGDEQTLREFLKAIEQGPPLAEVTDIRYQFEDKEGGFTDFEILY